MTINYVSFTEPRCYINDYFQKEKITLTETLALTNPNKPYADLEEKIFDAAWLDYKSELNTYNSSVDKKMKTNGFSESDMKKAFFAHKDELAHAYGEDIKKAICYDASVSKQIIKSFIELTTGNTEGLIFDIDCAVFEHFIWQVKRKMHGKKIEWHMMPVFFGKQGNGKTETLCRVLSPLYHLKRENKIAQLVDVRYAPEMRNFNVAFCDEMEKAEKCDVDALKNTISSDMIDSRILGTNRSQRCKNNVVFLGAANMSLYTLINDATGLRRFWQISTRPDMKDYWDQLRCLDFNLLWKCVDENVDVSPVRNFMANIEAHHKEFLLEDDVGTFLTDLNLRVDKEVQEITLDYLFCQYMTWSDRCNMKYKLSKNKFSRNLTILGFKKGRSSGGITYQVNKHASIPEVKNLYALNVVK